MSHGFIVPEVRMRCDEIMAQIERINISHDDTKDVELFTYVLIAIHAESNKNDEEPVKKFSKKVNFSNLTR